MKDNPFASFAATPAPKTGGGGSWMSTRKRGKDDSVINRAKKAADEARKAKNRRGGTNAKVGKAGGRSAVAKKRRGGRRRDDNFIDDSDEESFAGYSEEEEDEMDDFITHSGDEAEAEIEEEEAVWDSEMEDEDDDDEVSGRTKKRKKQQSKAKKKLKAPSRSASSTRRTAQTSTWRPPFSQNSVEDDDIEDSPVPPARGGGRRAQPAARKKVLISLDSEDDMSAFETKGRPKEKARSPSNDSTIDMSPSSVAKQKKKSKYFSEEKKEDEDDENMNGVSRSNLKRKILDDSEDSDDDLWGLPDALDDDISDTPRKSVETKIAFPDDDYADEDEARAIQEAMKASLEDTGAMGNTKRKRLKKKSGKTKGGRRKNGSSLEQIKTASPAKDGPSYKDDVESLKDSDSDDVEEDDEVEVYEAVDEEEQTAAQVLNEANALSAKIVRVVSGWCGALDGGDKVKGMILGEGEGTLSIGGGGGGDAAELGKGVENVAEDKKREEPGKPNDDMWISNETMKEIMPNVKLAEYQLLGVNWIALLNRTMFGKGGGKNKGRKGRMNVNGILADEMGLGKTVQTIAFLAWLNHQRKHGKRVEENDSECIDVTPQRQRPHLIVVPASVLSNWMNEFKKFAPEMTVIKYHGNQAEREVIRCELDHFTRGNVDEPLDAVLTTFSYFSSDSNKGDRSFLRKFEFDYLVVDEGHTLKNPKGLRYKNLNKFQTSHRLLLTGTPVQNSPKELMSLLCFLMPLFDTKTKSSKRKRGYDADDDDENDGGERMLEYFVHLEGGSSGSASADAKAYRKLKQLFAPFVLRRKKEDVLGQILPPKTRTVDIVPMDEATRIAYETILSSHVEARRKARANPMATTDAAAQKHLFTTLRKAANHPLLLRNRYTSEGEKDNLARLALDYHWFGNDASCTLQLVRDQLDKHSDYEVHCAALHMIDESPARRKYLEKYTLMEEDLFCSPKFVRLRTLLPELISKGHRILIFSQWTKVLDLMGHLMEHLDMKYLRLDGSTAVSERQDLIDTFNNDASIAVFLLSTRAGGMGLNLTSADVCILHDLDFNPFNDRQAEDRCHRIGQKKPVKVIKMVCGGTVDEDIYSIQERKARMNEAIMEEESGGKKRKKKSSDNDEMCRLANAAVERFLKSPTRLGKTSTTTSTPTSSAVKYYDEGATEADPATILVSSVGEKEDMNNAAAKHKRKILSINLSDCSSDHDDDLPQMSRQKANKSNAKSYQH